LQDLALLRLDRMVEALLAPWAASPGPGATVGVVQDGALLLHRHAGLASIEQAVPIGPETRFRIASVSKQFTAAAVLMLEREGRLGVDDLAAGHLPELNLDRRITLAHLMHNTSGIRDMLDIMRLGGTNLGTPVTQQQLLDGIARQRGLNFEPGSRFLYSNSNFLLLGLVVERITGQTLESFLEQRIFVPLGMTRTLMTPDVHVAVPGLATGYHRVEADWARAPHAFPLHGEGGLVSCVPDLALWDANLDAGPVGGDWLAPALSRQTPFGNGATNRYARGQVVRDHRGLRTISHGGLWPGYRTEFLRVPDRRTAVIVITNAAPLDPNAMAHAVLDAILDADRTVVAAPPWPERQNLHLLAGRYLDPAGPASVDIAVPGDGPPTFTLYGLKHATEPLADGRIATARANVVFAVRPAGEDAIEVEQDAGTVGVWRRAGPGATMPTGLAGTYRSDEMDATWTMRPDANGGLAIDVRGPVAATGNWRIEALAEDVVRIHVPGTLWPAWLDTRVQRDGAGAVTGLKVNGGRARGVLYARVQT
jgi:D-aminopeptidase